MKRQFGFYAFAALLVCAALVFGLSACSSGGDDGSALLAVTSGGSGTNPAPAPTPTPTPTPTPAATYTVTFNANDGSQNPATATQSFTEGTPQALKTIAELGFSKSGFSFAGWGTTADATESAYADGNSYTATANVTLYALWSSIPVFSVNIPVNDNGSVTASPATATVGTVITLSNTPKAGYKFASYSVIDADGEALSVTDGKFTMPAKYVTVTAVFTAKSYTISRGKCEHGTLTVPTSALCGSEVALSDITPDAGYEFASYVVTAADSTTVSVRYGWQKKVGYFIMPAQNVTVTATFNAISYSVNLGTTDNGSLSANFATATVGTTVTITANPATGFDLSTLAVFVKGNKIPVKGIGNVRTFEMPAVNVNVDATFMPSTSSYTQIGTKTINGIEYNLVSFGSWPQTVKASDVIIDETQTKNVGMFTYCKGNDGKWYCKAKENPYKNGLQYSDGSKLSYIDNWFKVEPIKWRVLTTDYNGTGKKILLAENVLTRCLYYDNEITRLGYYPNNYEHSKIRAFLNGLSYKKREDDAQSAVSCKDFLDKGFLQTAFTESEQAIIVKTSVDNSSSSTSNDYNGCASDTPTEDKAFLLSYKEVRNYDFGSGYGGRVRKVTDYAMANRAYNSSQVEGYTWWLRSPNTDRISVQIVYKDGGIISGDVDNEICAGVVPALCVEN